MKSIVCALFVALSIPAVPATAAMLVNDGADPVVVQVSEASGRMDVSLDPGASEEVCPSGCFLTLPSGDRIGLAGGETVEIRDGTAHIQ